MHIKTYAIVQGCVNVGMVIWFVATLALGRLLVNSYRGKLFDLLEGFLIICLAVAYCFQITWAIFGSASVWDKLSKWIDDHSPCYSELFIGAVVYLCIHYLIFIFFFCSYCVRVVRCFQ